MRYEVKVQKTVIWTGLVTLTARDEEAAMEKAEGLAEENNGTIEWELDDEKFEGVDCWEEEGE